MTVWTRAELDETIGVYKTAIKEIAVNGKSTAIAGTTVTEENLTNLKSMLDYFDKERSKLDRAAGRGRLKRATVEI